VYVTWATHPTALLKHNCCTSCCKVLHLQVQVPRLVRHVPPGAGLMMHGSCEHHLIIMAENLPAVTHSWTQVKSQRCVFFFVCPTLPQPCPPSVPRE
jgi:hypothetical protein